MLKPLFMKFFFVAPLPSVCFNLPEKFQPAPAMNAYLFTAIQTISGVRQAMGRQGPVETFQTWDHCATMIVLAEGQEEAQQRFANTLNVQPESEHPWDIQTRKVAAAQLVDQLITETGSQPLDWTEIQKQAVAQVEAAPMDDLEQGYWVEVNSVVPPGQPSPTPEDLQQQVPADIRSGLNWSPDKMFFYLLTVLASPPLDLADDPNAPPVELRELPDEADEFEAEELQRLLAAYPEGGDKDGAALILARNSVVAAWLWRRFAADTPLAANAIRIDPLGNVLSPE
jgi:hypothetical protein